MRRDNSHGGGMPPDFVPEEDEAFDPSAERPAPRRWVAGFAILLGLGGILGAAVGGVLLAMPHDVPQEDGGVASTAPLEPQVIEDAPVEVHAGDELLEAQARVLQLENELLNKSSEYDAAVAAAGLDPQKGADLAQEVAYLKANLEAARGVRDRLRGELKAALAEVDAQTHEAELARTEAAKAQSEASLWRGASTRNLWAAFAGKAKTEICDHGARKAVDKCQATVDAYFTDARFERFAECADSGQAVPALYGATRGDVVPTPAEAIRGPGISGRHEWYVVYCDPTLPEQSLASDKIEPAVMSVASR